MGAGRWGWVSASKGLHVKQVEAEVLEGGATVMGLQSDQGPPGGGQA